MTYGLCITKSCVQESLKISMCAYSISVPCHVTTWPPKDVGWRRKKIFCKKLVRPKVPFLSVSELHSRGQTKQEPNMNRPMATYIVFCLKLIDYCLLENVYCFLFFWWNILLWLQSADQNILVWSCLLIWKTD